MEEKKKRSWFSKIFKTFIGPIVVGIILMAIPNVWLTIKPIISKTLNFILHLPFYRITLPLWELVLFIVIIVVILMILITRNNRRKFELSSYSDNRREAPVKPDWYKYKSHKFIAILWRWEYEDDLIVNLTASCPICKTEVLTQHIGYFMNMKWKCSNIDCDLNKNFLDWREHSEEEIKNTIIHKIKSGEYKKHIDK